MNRLIEAIGNFRFSEEVIDHLVSSGVVSEGPMTDWLANYQFRGDVTGYADGELFFPYSPVLQVEGSFAECVVLETVLLSVLNHDCAVASAAAVSNRGLSHTAWAFELLPSQSTSRTRSDAPSGRTTENL